jgi:uncharacterized protein HemY
MGSIFFEQKQYINAKNYQKKALNLFHKDENIQMEGQIFDNISDIWIM